MSLVKWRMTLMEWREFGGVERQLEGDFDGVESLVE